MEIKINPPRIDLEVFDKLDLERKPVAVKFLYTMPKGIERLEKKMKICEMIGEAQRRGKVFYIDKENEDCFGKRVLGMEEFPSFAEGGVIGEFMKIYEDARANRRLYYYAPVLKPKTINYVVFSRLDKLSFDPDLLIVIANVRQAELILRAMSYSTGEPYVSRHTFVLGCSWLFAYPIVSGKVNYIVSGLTHGTKVFKEVPEGQIIISIPYNWIPVIVRNLQDMPWVLPSFEGKEKSDKILEEIARKFSLNEK